MFFMLYGVFGMDLGVFVTFWRELNAAMRQYEHMKMKVRGGERTIGTMRTKKEGTSY